MSARHCDGVGTDPAADCLAAGVTKMTVCPFTFVPRNEPASRASGSQPPSSDRWRRQRPRPSRGRRRVRTSAAAPGLDEQRQSSPAPAPLAFARSGGRAAPWVLIRSSNRRQSPTFRRRARSASGARKLSFAGNWRRNPQTCALCLPCRRSRVRIPSAASGKGLQTRVFFGPPSSSERLSSRGLAEDRRARGGYARFETRQICRQILLWSNRCHSAGLQKVRRSACCGRYPDSCCNGTILRTAPAGAIPSGRGPWGPVRFQSGTARSTSTRSATPRAVAARAVSFSAGRRPRQRRGPHHEELVSRQSHGGHRRGCRFPSASRRPRAPRLGYWLPSAASVCELPTETLAFSREIQAAPPLLAIRAAHPSRCGYYGRARRRSLTGSPCSGRGDRQ
jgi:hypothetical protein